jgi:putative transposase
MKALNFRGGWRGHLWQGRFASFPLDQGHLLAAARYVELNPVRAGIRRRPDTHPWSSARAHLAEKDDELVKVAPLLGMVGDWKTFLAGGLAGDDLAALRSHERTGRPLGKKSFVAGIEAQLGRSLAKCKPGPKKHIDK